MESLYFITGLITGGTAIYLLKRDEINRITSQLGIVTDLLNARLGYRSPKVEEPEVLAADPETPEYWANQVKTLTSRAASVDDEMPDLLARQNHARGLTEAETQLKYRVEAQMAANSTRSFLVEQ